MGILKRWRARRQRAMGEAAGEGRLADSGEVAAFLDGG